MAKREGIYECEMPKKYGHPEAESRG